MGQIPLPPSSLPPSHLYDPYNISKGCSIQNDPKNPIGSIQNTPKIDVGLSESNANGRSNRTDWGNYGTKSITCNIKRTIRNG